MNTAKDRCDYRTMNDRDLIEESRYNPNAELAIALAERLEEVRRHIDLDVTDYG